MNHLLLLVMIAAISVGSPVNEQPGSWLLRRDTTPEAIKAWKAENQRAWESLQERSDSEEIELVGRWPFAGAFRVRPSWNVAQDSIMYMSSGSGIRVLKLSNPARPEMVGQVNCHGVLYGGIQSGTGFVSRDTLLYVINAFPHSLQAFSVADPTQPYELGRLETDGEVRGIALKDSFAFLVGWDSLFRVVNIADPCHPHQVTTLLMPDDALGVDVKGDYAYVACAHAGLVSVGISNPLEPQQRGQVAGFTGIWVVCDTTRELAYIAGGAGGLHIINIANPSSLQRISTLVSTPTIDVFKVDTFVYLAGSDAYESMFYVVSVADSAHPRLVGQIRKYGWADGACVLSPFSYAYTTDSWEGLHIISLIDPANPAVDTAMWGAWTSYDLAVQDSLVYYANHMAGLKILSTTNVSHPSEIGSYDTLNIWDQIQAVAVKDSFAYVSWFNALSGFRSVDVSDPTVPRLGGTAPYFNQGECIEVRDTFAYVAEDYKFEVYNIAQPRQPVRVGRCDLPGVSRDLVVRGSLAYVTPWLEIVDISNPAQPWLVSSTTSNRGGGHALLDTFAYCTTVNAMQVFSIANPSAPYLITTVPTAGLGHDVDIAGSFAYVGCNRLEAFDISSPASPVRVGYYDTPHIPWKVRCDSGYVYVACMDGGLCVFQSCTTGIAEASPVLVAKRPIRVSPNPTSARVILEFGYPLPKGKFVSVLDITGREVIKIPIVRLELDGLIRIDLSALPEGCYFLWAEGQGAYHFGKVVITRRR